MAEAWDKSAPEIGLSDDELRTEEGDTVVNWRCGKSEVLEEGDVDDE